MKYNNKKLGFTLAEMLVCLALISILATILIPAIMHIKPNKNKILFRKAYMLTERIVNEMINDEDYYIYKKGDIMYSGFEETSPAKINPEAQGSKKFCILFASKLNTIEKTPNCSALNLSSPSFTTSDGITWVMPINTFQPNSSGMSIKPEINIDVNGKNKPNCTYNAKKCPNPDRFEITVNVDGSVSVDDDFSKEYLKSSDITNKK